MFRRVLFCLSLFVSPVYAVEVDLFSSGQGNTILVRHENEAMLIDAGSSEMAFSAAYQSRVTLRKEKFKLEDPFSSDSDSSQECISEVAHNRMETAGHEGDSTQSSSGGNSGAEDGGNKGEGDSSAPPKTKRQSLPTKKQLKKEKRDVYEFELIDSIRCRIPCVKKGEGKGFSLRLRTLVVTHADQDHYNLFPAIFPISSSFCFHIETVILGGLHQEYSRRFQEWLGAARDKECIGEIVFTGMADGGEGGGSLDPRAARYARPYCSAIREKREIEVKIEKALTFTLPWEGDVNVPKLEILSMNAGHTEEQSALGGPPLVRRANPDKNANSMVLRVSGKIHSLLLTGDAERPTWEHVLLHYPAEKLRTDYLVLSHHGSKEGEATSPQLLDCVGPKACFLSVGRHQGCSHPAHETVDAVLSSGHLYKTSQPHSVSYYGGNSHPRDSKQPKQRIHMRKWTRQALFSTLNSGHISIDLDALSDVVEISQMRENIYEDDTGQKFRTNYNRVYYPIEGKSLQEAVDEIVGGLRENQVNVTFWSKIPSTSRITSRVHRAQPPINEAFERQAHILIDEVKGRSQKTDRHDRRDRIYFLDPVLDQEGDAASERVVDGGGAASAASAAGADASDE